MPESEYIRVKVKGPDHERSILRAQYDAQPDAYTVVDKPAEHVPGDPIEPKYKTSVSAEAAKKNTPTTGQKADTQKEL